MKELGVGKVLVTGADGFVGQYVLKALESAGASVVPVVRCPSGLAGEIAIGDIAEYGGWEDCLRGVERVIHLAGRAHVLKETSVSPEGEFLRVNVAASVRLANAAVKAGTRRIVFISSIGVLGNRSNQPLTENANPGPIYMYGRSKWEAEKALRAVLNGTSTELTIIRPPMVVGPRVKGNMLRLMRVIRRGVPLPLASVDNRRSMVAVTNLADFMTHAAFDHRAAGEVFLIADDPPVSTREIIRQLSKELNPQGRVFPVPVPLLRWLGKMVGREREFGSLLNDFEIDSSKARELLDWGPKIPFREEVSRMTRWFREEFDQ